IGKVEDQLMILRRGFADLVSPVGREFEMVGLLRMPKDNAIEAVMVVKLGEDRAAEPCGIHLSNGCSMVGGSGDTEHSASLHRSASSSWSRTPGIRCTRQRLSSLPW